jgi:TolB-like protein
VKRLERSVLFAGSDRLLVLLRFIVEETLDGAGSSLKEVVIGNAVYGREPPYDPRIDSTVRVEARRLRSKLDDYYASEGRSDPVRIGLPTGGYMPTFFRNESQPQSSPTVPEKTAFAGGIFEKGGGAAIAVMPFRALTRAPEDEDFADGLTDELIFTLGRAQGLRVVSRNTAFQYKNRIYSLAEAARELGVDALLQGTIRRDGDMIRVTIEVSDPVGFVVWSDRFDAPSTERMRLQERIAMTILSRIRFDSSEMRAMRIAPAGPAALKSMAGVYRARQLLDEQTPGAINDALDIFKQVSKSAPDYARGHSGVADCYCDLYRLGLIDHATALSAAQSAAQAALRIDSRSVEAHAALATIAAWLEWNRVAADDGFQEALRLGVNARAQRLYGVLLTITERHDEAERMFRDARGIEPFSVQQDIAETVSHYQARRFHLLLQCPPEMSGHRVPAEVLVYRALAHILSGDPANARPMLGEIENATTKHPDLILARAEFEALLGEPARGARLLGAGDKQATCFARAMLAVALAEDELGIEMLEAAMHGRELSAVWIRTDARLDRLRAMPRFVQLMERLNAYAPDGAILSAGR